MPRHLLTLRRLIVVALLAAGVVIFAVAISGGDRHESSTFGQLRTVQRQVEAQRRALALQGIYLANTGLTSECVAISLVNPTRPNIAYVKGRFGSRVCVENAPDGPVVSCTGDFRRDVPEGPVVVPDLLDLGVFEAEKRVVREGLTFAIDCLTDREREPERPARLSPDALVRVVAQCPRPGQRVPAGSPVALGAEIVLPGGITYRVGALDAYHTGTSRPCADRRNPN